jgi:hypothetical protein
MQGIRVGIDPPSNVSLVAMFRCSIIPLSKSLKEQRRDHVIGAVTAIEHIGPDEPAMRLCSARQTGSGQMGMLANDIKTV